MPVEGQWELYCILDLAKEEPPEIVIGLDKLVNEFILGRIIDGRMGRWAKYTANNGPKVHRVYLQVAVTAGQCSRTLAK